MVELIARISKGSKMDQVYLPKNRSGFEIGSYIVIKPLGTERIIEKPYFYNIKDIEPVKAQMINEIFRIIDKNIQDYENAILTGSFLDRGFNFNDIDILLVSKNKVKINDLINKLEKFTGIKIHIIILDNKTLINGLETDPLYIMMLSKCISKKRLIYKIKYKIDYKLLDLELLKSKLLIDNFDYLDGNEKYYFVRNIIAIYLFIQNKKISKEIVDKKIVKIFNLKGIDDLKKNKLDKVDFLKKYKSFYQQLFNLILKGIKNGSK